MKKTFLINILFLFIAYCNSYGENWNKILDLDGTWKFNIGDNPKWAEYKLDDSDWEDIHVPSTWEDQGFNGYNGYAWYRKNFRIPKNILNKSIYLSLGYIDDVDEVYLNGKLIGSTGSFPPEFNTAYNAQRNYHVNSDLFKIGTENVIAVRVYDAQLSGGIISGEIALTTLNTMDLAINLDGYWKFNLGDSLKWKNVNFNDNKWQNIIVPSKWDVQGYSFYDGFAWYRKKFYLDMDLEGKDLVLLLGKIDDIDQCFFNGKMIGSTGDFVLTPVHNVFNDEWLILRGYYIPNELLKFGEENVIAVRVYDGLRDGGIYEGPIGITTQSEYTKYWREKKKQKTFWDYLFNEN